MNFEKLPEPILPPRRTHPRRKLWLAVAVVMGLGALAAWGWWRAPGVPNGTSVSSRDAAREVSARPGGEAARQAAQLAPVLTEVVALDAQIAEHLRRRELYQAKKGIAEAWEKLEAAVARAPLAGGVDETMRLRLAYLNRRHADFARVQELAHESMRPEANGTWTLEVGIGEELYRRVMGAGSAGSAEAAGEFCRRLGWMLGGRVRLAEWQAERNAIHAIVEIEPGKD